MNRELVWVLKVNCASNRTVQIWENFGINAQISPLRALTLHNNFKENSSQYARQPHTVTRNTGFTNGPLLSRERLLNM